MKVQRLRFRYSLRAAAADLGQRELAAAWEHACMVAALPLAYSGGKRPSPLISIAAPLPQGVTSDCELLDLVLSERIQPPDVLAQIEPQLPPGIRPSAVEEVGVSAPSLQSQVRWAEYEVRVRGLDHELVQQSLCRVLEATTMPAEYQREKKVRTYDLRPLIIALDLSAVAEGEAVISMRLRAEPERTARADQVASALGLPDERRIHRTRLVLEEVPPAVLAYRRLNGGDDA
jgi:radical SAM-linked protein